MSKVQAVLFDKAIYTPTSAAVKLKMMGFRAIKKPHVTTNKIRFRLEDPSQFDHFATMKKSQGIELVVGYLRKRV